MKQRLGFLAFIVSLVLVLSGCLVRTYTVTKDRVDQDLYAGNKGCLQGNCPSTPATDRKLTRESGVIEIELSSPIKFEKKQKAESASYVENIPSESIGDTVGNRGYITESVTPEVAAPIQIKSEKYTVMKGDTLQKISLKFYGTTKKWNKIYQANSDVLKAANKIYPGQVINVPLEEGQMLKEPKENLK